MADCLVTVPWTMLRSASGHHPRADSPRASMRKAIARRIPGPGGGRLAPEPEQGESLPCWN